MSLASLTRSYVAWLATLVRRIVNVAPLQTLLAVPALLASQIALIIAFFMPLKLLIVIGAGSVPRYFRPFFGDMEKDALVIVLSALMVGAYLLHLAANRLAARAMDAGAARILAAANKLTFLRDQEAVCRNLYESVCESLAALLFTLAAIGLGLMIYPGLFLFISALMLVALGLTILLAHAGAVSTDWLYERNEEFIDTLAIAIFFSSIGFVIAQFIFAEGPNFLIAIISMLIVRRLVRSSSEFVSDAVKLDKRKQKIDALFHPQLHFTPEQPRQVDRFWSRLDRDARNQWLFEMLEPLANGGGHRVVSAWRDVAQRDVIGLDVRLLDSSGRNISSYFVKLFPPKQQVAAAHESSLLLEHWAHPLPAPRLLLPSDLETMKCLVYEPLPPETAIDAERQKELAAQSVVQCWAVKPPTSIVDQFARSRPMLAERLDEVVVRRLAVAANNDKEAALVGELAGNLGSIRGTVGLLPTFVFNPRLKPSSVLEGEGDRLFSLDWSGWSIQPLGVGLREANLETALLPQLLAEAAALRPELNAVQIEDVQLAASLSEFLNRFERQQFHAAIGMIPELLQRSGKTQPVPELAAAAS